MDSRTFCLGFLSIGIISMHHHVLLPPLVAVSYGGLATGTDMNSPHCVKSCSPSKTQCSQVVSAVHRTMSTNAWTIWFQPISNSTDYLSRCFSTFIHKIFISFVSANMSDTVLGVGSYKRSQTHTGLFLVFGGRDRLVYAGVYSRDTCDKKTELRACKVSPRNLHWLGLRKAFLSKWTQKALVLWPQANSSHASVCWKAFLGVCLSIFLLHLMFGETLVTYPQPVFLFLWDLKRPSSSGLSQQCSTSWISCPGGMTLSPALQLQYHFMWICAAWHLHHCYSHIWFISLSLLYPLYSQNIKECSEQRELSTSFGSSNS